MGVNSLPMTVTRQRRGCDLNPGPSAPESSTLTSRRGATLVKLSFVLIKMLVSCPSLLTTRRPLTNNRLQYTIHRRHASMQRTGYESFRGRIKCGGRIVRES